MSYALVCAAACLISSKFLQVPLLWLKGALQEVDGLPFLGFAIVDLLWNLVLVKMMRPLQVWWTHSTPNQSLAHHATPTTSLARDYF